MDVKLYAFVIVINENYRLCFHQQNNQEMKTFNQEDDFVCVYSHNLKTEQKTDIKKKRNCICKLNHA